MAGIAQPEAGVHGPLQAFTATGDHRRFLPNDSEPVCS